MAGLTQGLEPLAIVPVRPEPLPAPVLRPVTSAGFPSLAAAVVARYAPCGRAARGYVAGKLRHDPVHRAVLALAEGTAPGTAPGTVHGTVHGTIHGTGLGDVVDLGCGRGQLGVALLLAGRARAVRGIDLPGRRLDQAAVAGAALGLSTTACDLAARPIVPAADTVLLIDVLYQMQTRSQLALLAAAAAAARRRVLVRTLDPARGLRSVLTVVLEHAWRRVSAQAGAMVNPRPLSELAGVLEAAGFAVSAAPCWRGTPFANVLLTAHRTGVS